MSGPRVRIAPRFLRDWGGPPEPADCLHGRARSVDPALGLLRRTRRAHALQPAEVLIKFTAMLIDREHAVEKPQREFRLGEPVGQRARLEGSASSLPSRCNRGVIFP